VWGGVEWLIEKAQRKDRNVDSSREQKRSLRRSEDGEISARKDAREGRGGGERDFNWSPRCASWRVREGVRGCSARKSSHGAEIVADSFYKGRAGQEKVRGKLRRRGQRAGTIQKKAGESKSGPRGENSARGNKRQRGWGGGGVCPQKRGEGAKNKVGRREDVNERPEKIQQRWHKRSPIF